MERHLPTIKGVDFDNGFIKEPMKYRRRLQRAFVKNRLGFSSEKKTSFILVFAVEEEGSRVWVSEVLLLFRIGAR